MKKTAEKKAENPALFKTYKLGKKMIRYIVLISILYFAYEGFMAWN